MVLRRRKHNLPKFPPLVRKTFRKLKETLPASDVAAYKTEVERALADIEKSGETNHFIDIRLARELADRCMQLLDLYPQYDVSQQAMIVAAIRYFAISHDSFSEEHFASGFDDDVKVMNHVLEEIGLEGRYIEIHR